MYKKKNEMTHAKVCRYSPVALSSLTPQALQRLYEASLRT